MLSDEALFALKREDLVDAAQQCYDEEVSRRKAAGVQEEESVDAWEHDPGLTGQPGDPEQDLLDDAEDPDGDGEPPEWLEEAACACAFAVPPTSYAEPGPYSPELLSARDILRTAGIPCHITMNQIEEPARAKPRVHHEYCLMVPGGLNLHATSLLDRDLFNVQQETEWSAHLESLSDEELQKLRPEVFCAGYLDRAARLKRAFQEELGRRRLRLG